MSTLPYSRAAAERVRKLMRLLVVAVATAQERTEARAALHQAAQAYRADIAERSEPGRALPEHGFVVVHEGEPGGWTDSVQRRPEGWIAGCVAVPVDPAAPVFVARGGTYMEGAERWEVLDKAA